MSCPWPSSLLTPFLLCQVCPLGFNYYPDIDDPEADIWLRPFSRLSEPTSEYSCHLHMACSVAHPELNSTFPLKSKGLLAQLEASLLTKFQAFGPLNSFHIFIFHPFPSCDHSPHRGPDRLLPLLGFPTFGHVFFRSKHLPRGVILL